MDDLDLILFWNYKNKLNKKNKKSLIKQCRDHVKILKEET